MVSALPFILIFVTALLGVFIKGQSDMRSDIQSMKVTLAEHSLQLKPMWAQVTSNLLAGLHHDNPLPKYKRMDNLIDLWEAGLITKEQRLELLELAAIRKSDSDVSELERKSAAALPSMMALAVVEEENG